MKSNSGLHVYSANCAWAGPIENVSTMGPGVPCCPYCKSVLFQAETATFWDGARKHEALGNTNYVEFIVWIMEQPRCYPDFAVAGQAFTALTGKEIVFNIKPAQTE